MSDFIKLCSVHLQKFQHRLISQSVIICSLIYINPLTGKFLLSKNFCGWSNPQKFITKIFTQTIKQRVTYDGSSTRECQIVYTGILKYVLKGRMNC